MQRLFVYGTLMPGRRNAHLLEDIDGSWQRGSIKGTLYPQGWGAALGYPAVVLDDEGDDVEGYVLSSPTLPEHWDRLDVFEGTAYRRARATVKLDDGGEVDAYVYVLRDS